MIDQQPTREEIVMLLRTVPDTYGEAMPFRQVVLKASPENLRDAIQECLLVRGTLSVNRRRMGTLATALVDRLKDALSHRYAAENRAIDAEAQYRAYLAAHAATAAALVPLPRKPGITRLEPKPKLRPAARRKR